jgi:hypothetical protein
MVQDNIPIAVPHISDVMKKQNGMQRVIFLATHCCILGHEAYEGEDPDRADAQLMQRHARYRIAARTSSRAARFSCRGCLFSATGAANGL